MKPDQLIALAVRLFAVWLFFYTVRQLISLAYVFENQGLEISQALFVGFGVLLLVITIGMWFFPFTVSKRISTFDPSSAARRAWSSDEVYGVGFILLGTLLLFFSVSDAIYWFFYIVWMDNTFGNSESLGLQQKGAIVATVVEIVFALALILGSKGLTGLVYKIRYGGLD